MDCLVRGTMLDHLADILDEYGEIDPENYRSDNTKALLHKYENMVDLRIVSRNQNRDKCDRATTDHALDRRSLSIIYKMISQGEFNEVSGCISTGKWGEPLIFTRSLYALIAWYMSMTL